MSTLKQKLPVQPMIVFGEDWGRHPSSTQHLIQRLAKDRSVVWANSIGMRRPRLNDLGRLASKIKAMVGSKYGQKPGAAPEETSTISVVSPKAVSWPGSRLASFINRRAIPHSLKKALARFGGQRPVLWLSLPTAVDVVGRLNEEGVVYYAGDDFSALAGVDHEPVSRMEQKLAAKADIIIAASPEIAKRFPSEKTFIIPHGADIDLFSKPSEPATELCYDDPRPVAGFYGAIDEWLDQDLLSQVIRKMPDWRFLFIGSVRVDVSTLSAFENVQFLGQQPHHHLPRYSQHWQASLLPFRDNDQIRSCDPLKLREYLAAGAPIVATPFPAAKRFSQHIRFEKTADRFAEAIRSTLKDTPDSALSRRVAVKDQTWEARAHEVSILIEALQNGTVASKWHTE